MNSGNKVFSPVPIIAFVCSLTFVFSFMGFMLGIASVNMKKIKLKGLGIAAIPIGAVFSFVAFIVWAGIMVQVFGLG